MGTSGQFAATQSSGLGLPIAKRAVESMGGEMGYNSKKGYGSLFWFTCLLETSNTNSDQEIIKTDAKETHLEISGTLNAEVLLVEDHEASRVLACEMLEWHGLDVTIARNGLEAVEIATSKKFSTILMDVNMPVMDGLIATQQIRKSGASVSARIIGVTAYGAPDEVSRFLLSGMDQVISKPLTNHDLHSVFKASQINLPSSVENIVGSEKMDFALDSLRTEVKTLLDRLVILDDKDELDEMADEAHRVKGLASILQFSELARFVSVCETHLRKGRRADARSLVGEIRKAMSTEALHYERDRKQP
jgi:CheY-like chemotaxis protein